MTTHEARLAGREEIAASTMAFRFEKPVSFTFKPGQAIDLILTGLPSDEPQSTRHTFSLVSAPFQETLTIATRMRDSAFKRALKALPVGSPVNLEGPFGALTLHSNHARPAVFVAGGIGITPFMSILTQAARDQLPQQLTLLYSNRRPEDAAFLHELRALEQCNRNFSLVATMTEMNKSDRPWTGATGLIDQNLISRVSSGAPSAPVYYIAGPPAMVVGLREMLGQTGISDDDIRSEEFYGY